MFVFFTRRIPHFSIVLLLLFWSSSALSDIRIASWNLLHGGWKNDKAMAEVSHIANHFDFLALQEVMNEEFMDDLAAQMEATSGEPWSWMASHAVGRSSYREMYAFLYRDSAVEYEGSAVVFIDHRDSFAREPYSAEFRSRRTGKSFAVGTVHIVFGDSISDRLPEIEALADYWSWLGETYPESPVLLMGDFNLPPHHAGWAPLRAMGATPAITEGLTTLGTTEGVWSSLYDNIWKEADAWDIADRGILSFPDLVPLTHVESRSRISDHAPIYITIGSAKVKPVAFDGGQVRKSNTSTCINLNKSPARQLVKLPNIGEVRADLVVQGRPWRSPESLQQIKGIGPATATNIAESGLLCQ